MKTKTNMKIGLGMYPYLLTPDNNRFAVQAGPTHVVAHLPGMAYALGWMRGVIDMIERGG